MARAVVGCRCGCAQRRMFMLCIAWRCLCNLTAPAAAASTGSGGPWMPSTFLSSGNCVSADQNSGVLCIITDTITLGRGPSANLPRRLEVLGQPGSLGTGQPTLDLGSLSDAFNVPATGSVVLRGLTIKGAVLPTSPRPLRASSFLALSAFKLPAPQPGAAALQLCDLLIYTPSCMALGLHQAAACSGSPSANFTVTPSALIVHNLITPTASITNVTLVCTGAPVPPPCIADYVADGGSLWEAARSMETAAAAVAAAFPAAVGPVTPSYLYLVGDASLEPGPSQAAAVSPAVPAGEDSTTTTAAASSSPLLSVEYTQLVIAGPPGGRHLLDLGVTPGLIRVHTPGGVELHNLTLRAGALGPTTQRPYGLMRAFLWAFDFSRMLMGSTGCRLLVRNCGLELAGCADEMAYWVAIVAGRDRVPEGLREYLCAKGALRFMSTLRFNAQVVDEPSGPAVLIPSFQTMSGLMEYDNVTLRLAREASSSNSENSTCGCKSNNSSSAGGGGGDGGVGSSGPDSGAHHTSNSSSSSSSGGAAPACAPRNDGLNGARSRCQLCAAVPEGLRGRSVADIPQATEVRTRTLPQYLIALPKAAGVALWMMVDDFVSFWPKSIGFPGEKRPWVGPANLSAPTLLLGAITGEPLVLDLYRLPAVLPLRAANASLTVRGVAFINLPPAGPFPVSLLASPPPPPAGPPLAPDQEPSPPVPPPPAPVLVPPPAPPPPPALGSPPGQALPVVRHLRRALRTWSLPSELLRSSCGQGRSSHTHPAANRGRAAVPQRRTQQAGAGSQDESPPAMESSTQGLSPALANFTSCFWALEFDRRAAVLDGSAGGTHNSSSSSGNDTSSAPGNNTSSSTGDNNISGTGGGGDRPGGLPYAFLDSVALLVPQAEVEWLARAWATAAGWRSADTAFGSPASPSAANAGAAAAAADAVAASRTAAVVASVAAGDLTGAGTGDTDPLSLAGQVMALRSGSILGSVLSAAGAAPPPATAGTAAGGDGSGSAAPVSLTFERLSWCGLAGRRVTITSVPPRHMPDEAWERLQPPLALELPPLPLPLPPPPQAHAPAPAPSPTTAPDPPEPVVWDDASPRRPVFLLPRPSGDVGPPPPTHTPTPAPAPEPAPAPVPVPVLAPDLVPEVAGGQGPRVAYTRGSPSPGVAAGAAAAGTIVLLSAAVLGYAVLARRQEGPQRLTAEAQGIWCKAGGVEPAAPPPPLAAPAAGAAENGDGDDVRGDALAPLRVRREGSVAAAATTATGASPNSFISAPVAPKISSSSSSRARLMRAALARMHEYVHAERELMARRLAPQSGILGQSACAVDFAGTGAAMNADGGGGGTKRRSVPALTQADAPTSDSSRDGAATYGGGGGSSCLEGPVLQSGCAIPPARVSTQSSPASGSDSSAVRSDDLAPPMLHVLGELGRGAQGVVYRGVWRGLQVAVKNVLLQQPSTAAAAAQDAAHDVPSSGDPRVADPRVSQAITEAAISASVSHPNLVATYTYVLERLGLDPPDAGPSLPSPEGGGELNVWRLTLVQELCDGGSLRACLASRALAACRVERVVERAAPPRPLEWQPVAPPGRRLGTRTRQREAKQQQQQRRVAQQGGAGTGGSGATDRVGSGSGGGGMREVWPFPSASCRWRLQTRRAVEGDGEEEEEGEEAKGATVMLPVPPAGSVPRGSVPSPVPGMDAQARRDLSCPHHLPTGVVLMVALQAACGLAHLHGLAIVHADVSSANILLASDPTAAASASGGAAARGAASGAGGPLRPHSTCRLGRYREGGSGRAGGGSGESDDEDEGGGDHLLRYGYVAKLCDFGLSGRLEVAEGRTHVSGPARRSSAYSPPELVRAGRAGPPGDVYALGVVMWELAQGLPLPEALARPEGARLRNWLAAQVAADPGEAAGLPPAALDGTWPPHVPSRYAALALRCLRESPADRPAAAAVCRELRVMVAAAVQEGD